MDAKAYRIETERLLIRCYQPEDALLLQKSIDESIHHLLPWMPWAQQEPEPLEVKTRRLQTFHEEFKKGIDFAFGIFSKDERVLIGSTGLHTRLDHNAREIGYWIHANYLRKGYAIESVKALTKVGFEIEKLDRIEIHCSTKNVRSQGIPKKLGFKHMITFNEKSDEPEEKQDEMIWVLSKEDYFESKIREMNIMVFDKESTPLTFLA